MRTGSRGWYSQPVGEGAVASRLGCAVERAGQRGVRSRRGYSSTGRDVRSGADLLLYGLGILGLVRECELLLFGRAKEAAGQSWPSSKRIVGYKRVECVGGAGRCV